MKKLALAVLLVVALSGAAFSTTVDYTTTIVFTSAGTGGTLSGGNTVDTITSGADSVTLTLAGLGATQAANYVGTPVGVDFGTITSTASPATGFPAISLSGVDVTLTINQTAPGSGTGTFVGSVSGTLSYNSGSGTLTFSPNTTVISAAGDIVDYEIDTLNIVVPSTGGGVTTINGFIDSVSLTTTTPPPTSTTPPPTTTTPPPSGTPEPGTMGLLGGSLLGFGFLLRRRFRK